MAKQYQEEYERIYGQAGYDEYEDKKLSFVRFIVNQEYKNEISLEREEINILNAKAKMAEFNYEAAIDICLEVNFH